MIWNSIKNTQQGVRIVFSSITGCFEGKNILQNFKIFELLYRPGVTNFFKNDLGLFSMCGLKIHQKHSAWCSERLFKHVRLFWVENNVCKILRFLNFSTGPGSKKFLKNDFVLFSIYSLEIH